jgi:hypothetical protein
VWSSVGLLNSSLPQNGAIRASADIVSGLARDDSDAAVGALKDPVIAGCPHVTPARFFQDLDYFTNFKRQEPVYEAHHLSVYSQTPDDRAEWLSLV